MAHARTAWGSVVVVAVIRCLRAISTVSRSYYGENVCVCECSSFTAQNNTTTQRGNSCHRSKAMSTLTINQSSD